MKTLRIAFDIDGTLVKGDKPNYQAISVYRFFQQQGHEMILWSGGGTDYAREWGEDLGLEPFTVLPKSAVKNVNPHNIDIAFDDSDVELAKVNVKVK